MVTIHDNLLPSQNIWFYGSQLGYTMISVVKYLSHDGHDFVEFDILFHRSEGIFCFPKEFTGHIRVFN